MKFPDMQLPRLVAFGLRQLYRVLVVYPFTALLWVGYKAGCLRTPLEVTKPQVRHCFLVTSVIYPRLDKAVSYGSARSPFTPEERAQHTCQTVASIRAAVPDARIVLIEAGLQADLPHGLVDLVDQYMYVGDIPYVRLACDSKVKSFGEAVMLLTAVSRIKFVSEYYFKLSGRYFLTNEFDLSAWHHEAIMVHHLQPDYISTRLYGFSQAKFSVWKYVLWRGLPFNMIDYAIENTMARLLPKSVIQEQPRLGLRGIGAGTSEVISE